MQLPASWWVPCWARFSVNAGNRGPYLQGVCEEGNCAGRKVLCRCEWILIQCLSALLRLSLVMLENPATCPACFGFRLLCGPSILPVLFTKIFQLVSQNPPALSSLCFPCTFPGVSPPALPRPVYYSETVLRRSSCMC